MKARRRLVYVPIIHAHRDSAGVTSSDSAVGRMWEGIEEKLAELDLPWPHVRIYQDGVPVCGEELELASHLAEGGNANFTLIQRLVRAGAALEGTEDIGLLLREYDLLSKLLVEGSPAERSAAEDDYQRRSQELLALRDRFIAERIDATLRRGETAVVFMGIMHRLDRMLERDFDVSYVIWRLPFRSIGAIYNA